MERMLLLVLLAVKPCVDDVKITSQHVLIATKRFAQPFDSAVFLNPNDAAAVAAAAAGEPVVPLRDVDPKAIQGVSL